MTADLGVDLAMIKYPPFSHHDVGLDFPTTVSWSIDRAFAASLNSSSLGDCTDWLFGSLRPDLRFFVESRLEGQITRFP